MDLARLHRAFRRRVALPAQRRFRPETDVSVGRWTFRIDVRDHVISSRLYLDEGFETELQRIMRTADLAGGVCVDIGANIGLHTLLLSELVGGEGRVIAFEPEERNYRLLTQNIRRNRALNIEAHRYAVGAERGTVRLALNDVNFGDHRVAPATAPGAQEVPLVTLDGHLATVPDGAIKLIKLDVQGYECHVLKGASETLLRNPDALVLIEVYPSALTTAGCSAIELMERLRVAGLDGWEIHDNRVLPVAEPWVYELIRARDVDLLLSRNTSLLRALLERAYGVKLPAAGAHASVARDRSRA